MMHGKYSLHQNWKVNVFCFHQHLHCLHQGFSKYRSQTSSSSILGIYNTCRLSDPTQDLWKPILGRGPGICILTSPLGHSDALSFENPSSINLVFKYRTSEKSVKVWSKVLCLSIKKTIFFKNFKALIKR